MTGKASPYRYTLILVAGVSAAFLLSLAWPRLRASVSYLPVDTAISNYWKSGETDAAQIDGLVKRARETIAIHDHYRYFAGLSEIEILAGGDKNRSLWQRRQALEDAITAATEVVRRAPATPRAWLRIARAKEFLAYPAEQLIPPLKMSILTGRVEPVLMLTRLELGLRHLPALDEEAVRLMRDQALLCWAIDQRSMLRRMKSGSLGIEWLRAVLAGNNPDVIAEMEAQLAN
jgi:hypothetical protein